MKAHTRLQKVYKELQRRGRQKRREFLEEQLAKAKLAAVRHDTKELYAVVRRLAPQQRRRNVRIRKPDGMPLCAEAEYDEILEYFTGLFSQQGFGSTASEPVAISSDRITITSSEVCSALKANKIGKAVPVQHAPASAWIACAGIPTLTEVVADEATGCISSERPISKLWSDCFLALIPKPNKALCRPENLRPLGIQDVAGKSFSRILKQRLLAQVGPRILQFPQFAYISGRSTEGAIARVVEHCNNVREELGHCKRNIYSKSGHKAMAINGGVQLAVDMSTAFDRVPRNALRQALV